jgi:ABC-2 type transport system ATP-binding protein
MSHESHAMIELDHVSKAFGGRPALHPLTLTIPEGRIFGLLGPNGAGKTTLLKIIMGLQRPDAGRVVLFGELAPGDPRATRRIGYMPQQLALYEELNARENVRFFGRLYGMRGDALHARTEEVLERVALSHEADRPVRDLSGGMQHRVMLATALVHRPSLLILDEPTTGVDPSLRLRFWEWFEVLSEEGASILVTTHHIAEAVHCQEVIFLRDGSLLERDAPQALIERYGVADLEAAFVQATRAREDQVELDP